MPATDDERPSQPGPAALAFLLAFDRIVRGLFAIEESGLPEELPRSCLIVANHRRDADIPILGAFLGRARGARITGVLPHFVAREDLFERGFLWHYWRSPWLFLPRLISPVIPLSRIMKVFKAHPIHRIPEQSLEIVLRDIRHYLGDARLSEVLNCCWLERLTAAGVGTDWTIARLLGHARQYATLIGGGWGHRRLNLETFRRFKPVERRRIAAHLAVFEAALGGGEAVMLAPEGANSPDGHLQRPRAGAWRLARAAGDDLPVLAVGLSYDPSGGRRRSRVFVHAGPVFSAGDFPHRRGFDAAVAAGILRATTLTGSHLAALHVLRASPGETFTSAGMAARVGEMARTLSQGGLRVAPDAAQDMPARLAWFERAGLLARSHAEWRRSEMAEPQPGWHGRAALAVFLRNELASAASLVPGASEQYGLALPPYAPWRGRLRGTTYSICYS
ncbi:MAG: 1-acyl-sn-glycerol-3-phosphate acyltransferase [Gammaproteobacteria bacterium]|nr:1-acyl-sn-glycerol-3-phosphate acyltransferase [Gammaproteobacteria bacterium]